MGKLGIICSSHERAGPEPETRRAWTYGSHVCAHVRVSPFGSSASSAAVFHPFGLSRSTCGMGLPGAGGRGPDAVASRGQPLPVAGAHRQRARWPAALCGRGREVFIEAQLHTGLLPADLGGEDLAQAGGSGRGDRKWAEQPGDLSLAAGRWIMSTAEVSCRRQELDLDMFSFFVCVLVI